jgi:hypothetical protein
MYIGFKNVRSFDEVPCSRSGKIYCIIYYSDKVLIEMQNGRYLLLPNNDLQRIPVQCDMTLAQIKLRPWQSRRLTGIAALHERPLRLRKWQQPCQASHFLIITLSVSTIIPCNPESDLMA